MDKSEKDDVISTAVDVEDLRKTEKMLMHETNMMGLGLLCKIAEMRRIIYGLIAVDFIIAISLGLLAAAVIGW